MGNNTTTSVSFMRRIEHAAFYMLHPRVNEDVKALIGHLLSMPSVLEVYLADGDFGYVIKARMEEDKEPQELIRFMDRTGASYGKATTFYKFQR